MSTKILLGIYLVIACINGRAGIHLYKRYKAADSDRATTIAVLMVLLGIVMAWNIVEIAR